MHAEVNSGKAPGVGALCRLDPGISAMASRADGQRRLFLVTTVTIALGSAVYGAVFGSWHSTAQMLYAAVKMPVLIASVTFDAALVNTMLAQVLGARLSFRQVCLCMATGFAITAAVLASLGPVVLFLQLQCPSSQSTDAMVVYSVLLPAHTVMIGAAGLIGNMRTYTLLRHLAIPRGVATRVMAAWILVTGLVGCELSWIASPFLARPDVQPVFFNTNAFRSNFFEYLWMSAAGRLTPMTEELIGR
jgi:hypothetical protein